MNPHAWHRIKDLFEAASELDSGPGREQFVLNADADEWIKAEVLTLLRADAGSVDRCVLNEPLNTQTIQSFEPSIVIADRFRIVRQIGHGGMGLVYEAEDLRLNEQVALKVVLPGLHADKRMLSRFIREVRLAKKITHHNICRIFDLHYHGDTSHSRTMFVTMELLHGETLRELFLRGPMAPGAARLLFTGITVGLAAAHSIGIIHRDLKSSNIMLVDSRETSSRPVIMDFGLAQQVDLTSTVTEAGVVVGTPVYMAPEQLTGGQLTPATDIYALGVLMYEALTGHLPFTGANAISVAAKRLQESPVSPRQYVPDLDENLERVILRCLERDPRNRFQTSSEVTAAMSREVTSVCPVSAPVWTVPYERNPAYTGRHSELEAIRERFGEQTNRKTVAIQAITGLGGIGKTQTAIEYAFRYCDDYSAILWVVADTEQSINSGFARLAALLDLPEKNDPQQDTINAAVLRWLSRQQGWLFVLDNADSPELIRPYLPHHSAGHTLLTSRAHDFQPAGLAIHPVMLETLAPDDASRFLMHRVGRERTDPDEATAAAELARELDYLPLALEQAAAFVVSHDARFQDYLASFRSRHLKLLEQQQPIAGQYSRSVATTWTLNFTQIAQSQVSADLLSLSAFLAPDEIPLDLFISALAETKWVAAKARDILRFDPLAVDQLLKPLIEYSLIRRHVGTRSYSIHRLTQAVLRDRLSERDRRKWANRAIVLINSIFPVPYVFENWPICERLISHSLACFEWIGHLDLRTEQAASLLNKTAEYLVRRAQYEEPERLLTRSLKIRERILDKNHPDTAETLNSLALLYINQNRLADAENAQARALAIREQAFGLNNVKTASNLNNLGILCYKQGRFEEAELLLTRALSIRDQLLGPKNVDIAGSLNNLAELYQQQARYRDAEPLLLRAVPMLEEILGKNHPTTAIGYNNLGRLYIDLDRLDEAETLLRRALALWEKSLPSDHPNICEILNSLGLLYRAQRRFTDSELHFIRAATIAERVFGPQHPDVATVLRNFALLLHDQGRKPEAELLLERVIAIERATVTSDKQQSDTANSKGKSIYSMFAAH